MSSPFYSPGGAALGYRARICSSVHAAAISLFDIDDGTPRVLLWSRRRLVRCFVHGHREVGSALYHHQQPSYWWLACSADRCVFVLGGMLANSPSTGRGLHLAVMPWYEQILCCVGVVFHSLRVRS